VGAALDGAVDDGVDVDVDGVDDDGDAVGASPGAAVAGSDASSASEATSAGTDDDDMAWCFCRGCATRATRERRAGAGVDSAARGPPSTSSRCQVGKRRRSGSAGIDDVVRML
jgi:hypothetical protein